MNAPPPATQTQVHDPKELEAQHFYVKAKVLLEKGALQEAEEEVKKIFLDTRFILALNNSSSRSMISGRRARKGQRAISELKRQDGLMRTNEKQQNFCDIAREHITREELRASLVHAARTLSHQSKSSRSASLTEVELRKAERAYRERLRKEAARTEQLHRQLRLIKTHARKELREKRERKSLARQERNKVAIFKSPDTNCTVFLITSILIIAIGVIKAIDYYFPKTALIAVVGFTSSSLSGEDRDILKAFPKLLADNIARCEHITVIAPSSTVGSEPSAAYMKTIAQIMQAQFIVAGSIEKSQTGFLISCWVIDQENHSIVCSFKNEGG